MGGRIGVGPRQIPGSGQQISLNPGNNVAAGRVLGLQTYAVLVSIAAGDPAVPVSAMVSVDHGGVASLTNGQLVKSSDLPVIIASAPGDTVAAYGVDDAGVVYLTELS